MTARQTTKAEALRRAVAAECNARALAASLDVARTLLASVLVIHDEVSIALDEATDAAGYRGWRTRSEIPDEAERARQWDEAGQSPEALQTLNRAASYVGETATLLVRLLGLGAYYWEPPSNATGATNYVEARDSNGTCWGVGQTEMQALRDAREHWKAEQDRRKGVAK